MTGRLPDPAAVVTALETAGFEQAGVGRHYLRYRWPAGRQDQSLLVLLDADAPEYATMVAALLAELDDGERRGQAAAAVLDLIAPDRDERVRAASNLATAYDTPTES